MFLLGVFVGAVFTFGAIVFVGAVFTFGAIVFVSGGTNDE